MLDRLARGSVTGPPAHPTFDRRRGSLPCSSSQCASAEAVRCEYVDRRGRECNTAWCLVHQQVAHHGVYCRRHAGIIRALGQEWSTTALPDVDNRAPSLANWVGTELNEPIRNLLERFFGTRQVQATAVISGGSPRERTWGRSWKLVSPDGVDLSVTVAVAEADDTVVRLTFDGRPLLEMVPPWIEARRRGIQLDAEIDVEARRRFYGLLLEDVESAMRATTVRGIGRPA